MPIRQKLMRVIFLISGMVIFITCITFLTYQFFTSKKNVLEKTSAIGKIISANSTAALAFQSPDDAKEILAALKAEPHIIAAALYDKSGNLFSYYPADADKSSFPVKPGAEGYRFTLSNLEGFQPVVEENRTLGSLYLKSDLKRLYNLLRLFVIVIIIVIIVSLLLSYFLSQILQKSISKPILALVETTKAISDKGDYSQRATKLGDDELGVLTDSFNHMLEQIQHRNLMLNEFNQNLEHKIAERTSELETVNKELESFSYSISHDLRAPLRSIIGFTSILEEDFADKLDGEAKRITSVIKSNTLKMGQLIDDLLSFSRMGRQEIKQSNFNTTEMVQQIIEELTANDKGI
jgi:signal transduction histidine kinase